MKLTAQEIAKSITESMKSVTDEIIKSIPADAGKDGKPVTVNVQIDEAKLAKSFETLMTDCSKSKSKSKDEDEDESVYVDEYDEMSERELRSIATSKGINVYSGTSVDMMKKKLRDFDSKSKEDKTTPEEKLSSVVSKAIADLGLDPEKIKFEIATKKKSVVNDKSKSKGEDDDEDDEDEDEGFDGNLEKSFEKMSVEDKAEAVGVYFGGMAKNLSNRKKRRMQNNDDE